MHNTGIIHLWLYSSGRRYLYVDQLQSCRPAILYLQHVHDNHKTEILKKYTAAVVAPATCSGRWRCSKQVGSTNRPSRNFLGQHKNDGRQKQTLSRSSTINADLSVGHVSDKIFVVRHVSRQFSQCEQPLRL